MANLPVYRGMKLTKGLAQKLEAAAREKGFSSPSAFIRTAIENELTSRKPVFDESEERVVATIDRLAQEMRKMSTGQQALFAFVDSLTKTLLTCLPEPSGEDYAQAAARAKARYERFIKNVRMSMAGDSRAAMVVASFETHVSTETAESRRSTIDGRAPDFTGPASPRV
jgi:hypothetical protein